MSPTPLGAFIRVLLKMFGTGCGPWCDSLGGRVRGCRTQDTPPSCAATVPAIRRMFCGRPRRRDRRKRALALLDAGHSLNEVGRRVGCNPSSVMRWRDARRRGGAKALRVRFSPGRPWKLNAAQRRRLVRFLLQGPIAQGYRTNLWTTVRIAEVVQRKFGIRYHRAHVGRLMHSLKWTPQKPERRALEQDEGKIKRWKQRDWPRVKKTLRGWVPISYLPTNPASF